jgi:hypothetical protein
MVEEMMDLETCQYIDFPGVGVIDLEAPQLPEKEYEVTAERRSNEPMIMETIVSVSKALQEYKRAGGFAKAAVTDAGNTVLAAPATNMEPSADASVPPRVDECREASPSQLVEATETPAPVAKPVSAEAVVGEEGTSSPDLVAAEAEGAETRVPGEPAAVAQESAVPEMVARATTPETRWPRRQGCPIHKVRQAARPRHLSSRVLRGRPPLGSTPTPRTTRRPRRATPWSVG